MVVKITLIKEKYKYEINGKLIYKDQVGKWQCYDALLPPEREAFKKLAALRFNDPTVTKKQ
jgi:hypothetical protein